MAIFNRIIYRILLCDDNRYFLENLKDSLRESVAECEVFTYEIDCAKQRDEIVTFIRNKTYDMIALDYCYYQTSDAPITVYESLRRLSLAVNLSSRVFLSLHQVA